MRGGQTQVSVVSQKCNPVHYQLSSWLNFYIKVTQFSFKRYALLFKLFFILFFFCLCLIVFTKCLLLNINFSVPCPINTFIFKLNQIVRSKDRLLKFPADTKEKAIYINSVRTKNIAYLKLNKFQVKRNLEKKLLT